MTDKTTEEVIGIARAYLCERGTALKTLAIIDSDDASQVAKLRAAQDYVMRQRKRPQALEVWLNEAIKRKESR